MKTCNAKAADKKGDERKAFMNDCLSAEPQAVARARWAMCNTKTDGHEGRRAQEVHERLHEGRVTRSRHDSAELLNTAG